MKCFRSILALGLALFLIIVQTTSIAMANIDWTKMTDEEIMAEIDAGKAELNRRNHSVLELGQPITISNKYGSYVFTVENAHMLNNDYWNHKLEVNNRKNKDTVALSIQGEIENIDCHWLGDFNYIPNYQIQEDMVVKDQDGYSIEVYDASNGEDGRYEVGAETSPGEKKRVSLIFLVGINTSEISISFKGYDGTITIPVK